LCAGDKPIQVRDACYRSFSRLTENFGDCSPEFFSEDEEDYSVYLVDPVETQQSGSTFNNASSSGGVPPQFMGVTVGLGVLSSLLDSSAEDVWVAGTIFTGPDGSESLEIVFTLKPVCGHLGPCGAIKLIGCGIRDPDEEETPASRDPEEAIQKTNTSNTSATFLPATGKVLFAHCPRDQSS
jgi:hypothetical protein